MQPTQFQNLVMENLPFDAEQKQTCLELSDPLERLQLIQTSLRDVRGIEPS